MLNEFRKNKPYILQEYWLVSPALSAAVETVLMTFRDSSLSIFRPEKQIFLRRNHDWNSFLVWAGTIKVTLSYKVRFKFIYRYVAAVSYIFEFCTLKILLNLPHENLVSILGGHGIAININGCHPNLEIAIYVLKTGVNPNIYIGCVPALWCCFWFVECWQTSPRKQEPQNLWHNNKYR